MTTGNRTSVMLVDDHSIMRDLLRDALENTGEFEVVAQAADGQEALRMVQEAAPDVIVMDVIMPEMDGIEACRQITAELLPGVRVLMLTASNEQDAIVRAIAAGATGYLQKYSGKEQLLTTLREVAEGEFRIPGDAARRLARAVRSPSGDASERLETLTDREREILKLFAEGLTYQEIGEIRNNSALTVRNAVSAVQRKLGFRTRQQMVLWAVRAGLVDGGLG